MMTKKNLPRKAARAAAAGINSFKRREGAFMRNESIEIREDTFMRNESIKISGMACPACAKGIEKVVGKLKGVAGASVAFESGELLLSYDERILPDFMLLEVVSGIARDVVEETRKMSLNAPLSGINCPECASRIAESLKKKEGVITASVNLSKKRMSVIFDPARIDYAQIKGAIGYAHCKENHMSLNDESKYCGCCETPRG
jgi:copper ion binding protein